MSHPKNNMKLIEIQQILEEYVIQANTQSQFSQRNTSLNAVRFVETLVLGWLQKGEASLNELAEMATDLGIRITGAAIHERLNGQAVDLLSAVLAQSLQQIGQHPRLDVDSLASFTAVHVTDSTQISLPAQLYEAFRGGNGDAKMKLQVTLDYLTGQWVGLEIMAGKASDQKSELPLMQAIPGSLNLFDLGYFKQERLQAIDEQGAYFVSRYQSQTALYDEVTGQRLDLVKCLKALGQDTYDRQVLLGGRTKLGVRLIAQRLPAKVADARRRKAKKKAKEQGKTCSATYLYLLGWDILVTNLPLAQFTPHQIVDFYSIRMQIEWVFRIWKSQLRVNHFGKKWRLERVLGQLYAHLIGILLCHRLTAGGRWQQQQHEYSFAKCVQLIQHQIGGLMQCLRRHWYGSLAWLRRLEDSFRQFGRKTKRKKEPSTLQILAQGSLS